MCVAGAAAVLRHLLHRACGSDVSRELLAMFCVTRKSSRLTSLLQSAGDRSTRRYLRINTGKSTKILSAYVYSVPPIRAPVANSASTITTNLIA